MISGKKLEKYRTILERDPSGGLLIKELERDYTGINSRQEYYRYLMPHGESYREIRKTQIANKEKIKNVQGRMLNLADKLRDSRLKINRCLNIRAV